MAKRHEGRVTNITTPSPYGSHAIMVVDNPSDHNVNLKDGQILCKDDNGVYITTKNHLNSGLADPNRCASNRLIDQPESIENN